MSSKVNFKGKLLSVATNLSPPYVLLNYNVSESEWHFSGGFEVELLKSMNKYFNFTYKIINCNSDWGIRLPDMTWTGIIGNVSTKRADIGFASLTITTERSEAVFFSNPHIITSVSFITPPPQAVNDILLVIEPFDYSVWICFIVSFILIIFTDKLISNHYMELRKIDTNWAIVCASLRQQTSFLLPSVRPLRLMMCCWLLVCLVLTSSYAGNLYSLMTFPPKLKTIDTITQLANAQSNGQIQVVATKSSAYFHSLKKAKFGVHQEIGRLIKPVKDKRIGLSTVSNSSKPHAFISTRDHLTDGVLRFGEKSFHLPPPGEESSVFFAIMAIALQKDFKYKKEFNRFISDVKKEGFLDYWKLVENRRILKNNQQVFDSKEQKSNKRDKLRLSQLQSAIYLFFIGILISSIVFKFELMKKLKFYKKY